MLHPLEPPSVHCSVTAPGDAVWAVVSRFPLLSNLRLPRSLSMFARCPLSVESRLTVFPLGSSLTVFLFESMPTVPLALVVDVPTCVTGTGLVLVFWTTTCWKGVVAAWAICSRNTVEPSTIAATTSTNAGIRALRMLPPFVPPWPQHDPARRSEKDLKTLRNRLRVAAVESAGELRSRGDAELAVGALQIRLDRLDAHEHLFGDRLVAQTVGGEPC